MYSQKRDRILALWNTGDYTLPEIGVAVGLSSGYLGAVLRRARLDGLYVLRIDPAERNRRAARSRQPDMGVMTPEASRQLRTAWLSGVSAVRIAVMLDTTERAVRLEARRLGLPRRSPR